MVWLPSLSDCGDLCHILRTMWYCIYTQSSNVCIYICICIHIMIPNVYIYVLQYIIIYTYIQYIRTQTDTHIFHRCIPKKDPVYDMVRVSLPTSWCVFFWRSLPSLPREKPLRSWRSPQRKSNDTTQTRVAAARKVADGSCVCRKGTPVHRKRGMTSSKTMSEWCIRVGITRSKVIFSAPKQRNHQPNWIKLY